MATQRTLIKLCGTHNETQSWLWEPGVSGKRVEGVGGSKEIEAVLNVLCTCMKLSKVKNILIKM